MAIKTIAMKRLFFLILVALTLSGCSGTFMTASGIAGKARLGMSIRDFQRLAGSQAELESMTAEGIVYRIDEYSSYNDHRYVSGAKLFYFDRNERLYKIDSRNSRDGFGFGRMRNRGFSFELGN